MNLPAGLADDNAEFFATVSFNGDAPGRLHAHCLVSRRSVPFSQFDNRLIERLERSMLARPEKHKAVQEMRPDGRMGEIEQYTVCTYGGFDNKPDMIDGVLQEGEFWPCPCRGACKFDGIVCCHTLRTPSGESLSKREVEVLKLIAEGSLDKEIAGSLHIALTTVTTHTKNIRRKTHLQRKADLSRFAHQNNLLC